jgi:hypothetical protein
MVIILPDGRFCVRVHGKGDIITFIELDTAYKELRNIGGVLKLCKHLDTGAKLINLRGVTLEYEPCDLCKM